MKTKGRAGDPVDSNSSRSDRKPGVRCGAWQRNVEKGCQLRFFDGRGERRHVRWSRRQGFDLIEGQVLEILVEAGEGRTTHCSHVERGCPKGNLRFARSGELVEQLDQVARRASETAHFNPKSESAAGLEALQLRGVFECRRGIVIGATRQRHPQVAGCGVEPGL